jgi:hypothetical protein
VGTDNPEPEEGPVVPKTTKRSVAARNVTGALVGGGEAIAQLRIEDLKAAIESSQVTLDQVAMARWYIEESKRIEEVRSSIEYVRLVPELLHTYQMTHSENVLDRHLFRFIPAAVVLLSEGPPINRPAIPRPASLRRMEAAQRAASIDLSFLAEASWRTDSDLEAAIWACKGLSLQAGELLPQRRATLLRSIYSVLVLLLSYADSEAGRPPDEQRLAAIRRRAEEELLQLKVSLHRHRLQQARILYLAGMFFAAYVVGALTFILASRVTRVNDIVLLLQVAAAGATGALVSVMTRTTRGKLNVDPDADRRLILLSGGFRLLIGAVFGLALFVFIEAEILPIDISVQGQQLTYFYLGVAFLAGFSERLAQDAVTRAGTVISVNPPDERQSCLEKDSEDDDRKS